MILARRVVPFVAPLFMAALLSGLFFRSQEWPTWFLSILALPIVAIGFMTEWKFRSVEFWNLLFPLFFVIVGGTSLIFFLNVTLYQLVVVIALVIVLGVYLESVFTYRYQPQKYATLSLPNMSSVINTFAGFALFTSAFALYFINRIPVWVLPIIAFAFSLAMMLHLFWGYKIQKQNQGMIIVIFPVIMAELIWVLHFWPTAFLVNGIIGAIVLYCVPSLIQLQSRDILTRRLLIQYIVVSLITILGVVATAQWT